MNITCLAAQPRCGRFPPIAPRRTLPKRGSNPSSRTSSPGLAPNIRPPPPNARAQAVNMHADSAPAADAPDVKRRRLLRELEEVLRREISAEKKQPTPISRKRSSKSKKGEARFGWAKDEKVAAMRKLLSTIEPSKKGAFKSLDDGRKALLAAVKAAQEPAEAVMSASGPRVAYLPDPVKAADMAPLAYAAAVVETLADRGLRNVEALTPEDVAAGRLEGFDARCGVAIGRVLLVPGGYAPNTLDALGPDGARRIRDFVARGGGYVGICAGAYLGCKGWFGLLEGVAVSDFEHWGRGRSDDCVLQLRDAALEALFGRRKKPTKAVVARYANGPLLHITDNSVMSAATFASDFTKKSQFGKVRRGDTQELARGVMPRYSAVVLGERVRGRVALISPHLEDGEPAARRLLRACVRWAARADTPLDDVPPADDVAADLRGAWLACRKSRYALADVATDHCAALRTLLREEATARRVEAKRAAEHKRRFCLES